MVFTVRSVVSLSLPSFPPPSLPLSCAKCWSEMEQRLGGSMPEAGSEREMTFEESKHLLFRYAFLVFCNIGVQFRSVSFVFVAAQIKPFSMAL